MASLGRKVFKGKSGAAYRFKVFPLGTRFRKISGVYVIANRCMAQTAADASCPFTWGTPRISRSHLTSITRPSVLSSKGLIASAFNRTLSRNPALPRNGTWLHRSVRRATTEGVPTHPAGKERRTRRRRYWNSQGGFMARDRNTYAKRQRETGKKRRRQTRGLDA